MGTKTISVPKGTDTSDWRTGLVVLPADHVYGKTALTPEDWRRRDAQRHGVLVLEERCAHTGDPLMTHEYPDRRSANVELAHRIELTPAAFDAQRGPIRMVLREVWR